MVTCSSSMFLTFNLLSEGLSTFIFLVVNSYFSCPPPTLKVLGYYLGWAKIRLLLSPYANPPRSFLFWPRIGPSFSDLGCLGGPAGLWFLVRNPVELDAPCGLADWSLPWPLCCYTYWLDRLLYKAIVNYSECVFWWMKSCKYLKMWVNQWTSIPPYIHSTGSDHQATNWTQEAFSHKKETSANPMPVHSMHAKALTITIKKTTVFYYAFWFQEFCCSNWQFGYSN